MHKIKEINKTEITHKTEEISKAETTHETGTTPNQETTLDPTKATTGEDDDESTINVQEADLDDMMILQIVGELDDTLEEEEKLIKAKEKLAKHLLKKKSALASSWVGGRPPQERGQSIRKMMIMQLPKPAMGPPPNQILNTLSQPPPPPPVRPEPNSFGNHSGNERFEGQNPRFGYPPEDGRFGRHPGNNGFINDNGRIQGSHERFGSQNEHDLKDLKGLLKDRKS